VKRALVVLILAAATASAQYVPPVPKGIGGGRPLQPRPIRFPSEQKWVRVDSPGFTIFSGASEGRTREVAANLETLTAALGGIDSRFATRGNRTRVLFFAKRADSQPYFDLLLDQHKTSAPGVFISTSVGEGTMIIDGTRSFMERTVFHELVHKLLSAGGARLPLWLEEGIAEYFSSTEIRGAAISIGLPIREHQSQLRRRSLIPLPEMFAMTNESPRAIDTLFYAQAWGVVDWMIRNSRPGFYRFVADVEAGMSAADAIRKNFNVNVDAVERGIVHHNAPPPSLSLRNESDKIAMTATPMSRADVLYELGRFLSSMEVTRPDGERHLRAAIEADPSHARAIAALGTLRARDKKYDEALPFFEQAIAADPKNGEIHVEFAEALLQNELGTFAGTIEPGPDSIPRARRARELAQKALGLGVDAARAKAAIGTSYLVESESAPGIAALDEALRLSPGRTDVALNLYALLVRSGDMARAQTLFDQRFARARDPQVQFAARSVFVRERLTAANTLIKDQKIDEAIALLDELMKVTPDEVARFELAEQKRTLSKVAETNRHILMYNEAVSQLNKGQHTKARATIKALLEVAQDPDVIKDAKALEKKLKR
jgi:tetratricopeptide (TPR) repeat protein